MCMYLHVYKSVGKCRSHFCAFKCSTRDSSLVQKRVCLCWHRPKINLRTQCIFALFNIFFNLIFISFYLCIGLNRNLDQACVPFRISYQDLETKHPQQKMKKLKILETGHQQQIPLKIKVCNFFAIWRTKFGSFWCKPFDKAA